MVLNCVINVSIFHAWLVDFNVLWLLSKQQKKATMNYEM